MDGRTNKNVERQKKGPKASCDVVLVGLVGSYAGKGEVVAAIVSSKCYPQTAVA